MTYAKTVYGDSFPIAPVYEPQKAWGMSPRTYVDGVWYDASLTMVETYSSNHTNDCTGYIALSPLQSPLLRNTLSAYLLEQCSSTVSFIHCPQLQSVLFITK